MTKKYKVLSPDGFTIEPTPYYKTLKQTQIKQYLFCERYREQGYYSTIRNGERFNIPLIDLQDYCEIITL